MENKILITDCWIETSNGKIFSRTWVPEKLDEKSPIVLFHDSLGCIQLWRDFPEKLAQVAGRKVIAYDRLGFGQSDRRQDDPTIDFIEKEADFYFPFVRQKLGFDRFIAFGHSVGGAMAILCAARFQNLCDAVITESAQAFVEARTLEGISVAKKNFEDASQFSKIQKYHGDKALWVLKAWTDIWLSKEFSSWSLKDELAKVKCPLLAIHGDKDEYGSLVFPEIISSLSSGYSEKKIIEDCGHVPHKEQGDVVLRIVSQFIRDNL